MLPRGFQFSLELTLLDSSFPSLPLNRRFKLVDLRKVLAECVLVLLDTVGDVCHLAEVALDLLQGL